MEQSLQKKLLRLLQSHFPLLRRPFLELAQEADVTEKDLLNFVREGLASGLIRRVSVLFNSRSLGYTSALVAAQVEPAQVEQLASFVNRHPGVTHNYERLHPFNLWFTVTARSETFIDAFLRKVEAQQGVHQVLKLSALEYYKLNVALDPKTGENRAAAPAGLPAGKAHSPISFSEKEKNCVRILQKEIPLLPRPFEEIGNRVGFEEDELLERLRFWKKSGVVRKLGAVLNHRRVGAFANAMVVWRVPEGISREVGKKMAAFPQVSHCYRRATYSEWPYSHYTMIHAGSAEKLNEVIQSISRETGLEDFLVLKTGREFKKVGMRYFEEEGLYS